MTKQYSHIIPLDKEVAKSWGKEQTYKKVIAMARWHRKDYEKSHPLSKFVENSETITFKETYCSLTYTYTCRYERMSFEEYKQSKQA